MTDLRSPLTLGQMVDRSAARSPDRVAVVFEQKAYAVEEYGLRGPA